MTYITIVHSAYLFVYVNHFVFNVFMFSHFEIGVGIYVTKSHFVRRWITRFIRNISSLHNMIRFIRSLNVQNNIIFI